MNDRRASALGAVVWVSAALAFGSALMAIGHVGVRLPLISALGPGGTRPVIPAVIAFTVAAVLHATVAIGAARRRSWTQLLGVFVGGLTLLGAATPFRGAVSMVGIVLAGLQLGLLALRPTAGARTRTR